LDDDKRAALYNRADHFRRASEFDKAAGIYDSILTEDSGDAEAYWLLVLCRYGVDYVKDPATHRMVPTVNRMQRVPVSADEDFKQALVYADSQQKEIFQQEATVIEALQKKALAISENEEPFDIFICFKETGADDKRTKDSARAQEIYQALTKEGYKVFFSRLTLQDKPGTEYEPYIFAALNSAPVMVVVGTSKDNLEAAWVKNEWSRYLALMKEDGTKHLVPVYEGMDPYDLPEEFALLQALDMGALGFIQDLAAGVGKMLRRDAPQEALSASNKEIYASAPGNNSGALIKRARLCCEDGDWNKADNLIEQALNIDPENGEAYLVKLIIATRCYLEEQLSLLNASLETVPDYIKVMRFGDPALKKRLTDYNESIKARLEEERRTEEQNKKKERSSELERTYQGLKHEMEKAFVNSKKKSSGFAGDLFLDGALGSNLLELAQAFKELCGYKDADALAAKCIAEHEEIAKIKEAKSSIKAQNVKIFLVLGTVIICLIIILITLSTR